MEKEKKKRLYLILKRIGIGIIIFIGLIILINSCTKKTNALEYEYQDNSFTYTPYQFIGLIKDINLYNESEQVYELEVEIDGTFFDLVALALRYDQGDDSVVTEDFIITNTIYGVPPQTRYMYFDPTNILAYNNSLYDITDIEKLENPNTNENLLNFNNCLFMFRTNINNLQDFMITDFEIYEVCNINDYVNYQLYGRYNYGYTTGLNENQAQAYNSGYNDGVNATMQKAQETIQTNNASYQVQINQLEEAIQNLMNQDRNESWLTFRNLLGLIFIYPVKFLKEGFDVNLFGVNIGGLMLGLLMIGITITLVGMFIGKRRT